MPIKIKNQDMYILIPFFNTLTKCKLSISQCVKNSTIINRLNEAMKIIEPVRIQVAQENGLKDDKGELKYQDTQKTMILLSEDGVTKLNELLNLETEVNLDGPQYSVEELELMGAKMDQSEYEALKRCLLK